MRVFMVKHTHISLPTLGDHHSIALDYIHQIIAFADNFQAISWLPYISCNHHQTASISTTMSSSKLYQQLLSQLNKRPRANLALQLSASALIPAVPILYWSHTAKQERDERTHQVATKLRWVVWIVPVSGIYFLRSNSFLTRSCAVQCRYSRNRKSP